MNRNNTEGEANALHLLVGNLLPQDWKSFVLANFLTALGALPFGLGLAAAMLTRSFLILMLACVLGGAIFGPALSGMVDCILRSLRHCQDDWWCSYRKAWKQNWRESLVPGIVLCLFVGFLVFMGLQVFWTSGTLPLGTALCCLASALLAAILFSVFWPQLVLFRQSHLSRLRNCLLFFFPNFLRCLAAGLLQVAWWVLMLVLYPGSLLLLLFLGFWLILYWTYQILYPALNHVFQIEEKIAETFPEQCM